jgi:hypothetical protein
MLLKVAGFDTAVKRAPTTPEIREACTAHFLPSPTLVQQSLFARKLRRETPKHCEDKICTASLLEASLKTLRSVDLEIKRFLENIFRRRIGFASLMSITFWQGLYFRT